MAVDENDLQTHVSDREDTMLYRTPTDGSDEGAITDIWGTQLETRVVDAKSDEFSQMLTEGWVRSPTELCVGTVAAASTISRDTSSSAPATDPHKEASEVAEKLARELGEKVKTLTVELEQARKDAVAAAEHAKRLEVDLSAEKALREAGSNHIQTLEGEIKELKKPKPRA